MKTQKEIKVSVIFSMFLKNWKLLVVGVLMGGLLFGGFSYIREYQSVQEQNKVNEEILKEKLEQAEANTEIDVTKEYLEEKLTDIQKNNVEVTLLYRSFYTAHKAYLDDSILMKMDPNAVYKAELIFRVESENMQQAYNLQKIYGELLDGEELNTWLNEQMGSEDLYLNEIIAVDKMADNVLGGCDIVSVTVIHYNEAKCKTIVECINDYMAEKEKQLKAYAGEHEVQVISSVLSKVADNDILSMQQDNRSTMSQLLSEVIGREGKFSDAERDYYDYILSETMTEGEALQEENAVESITTQFSQIEHPGINVMSVIVGMLFVVIMYFVYIIIKCILNDKILEYDRFDELYKITHIGMLQKNQKDINSEVISATIAVAAKKRSYQNVYLVGVDLDESTSDLCGQIKKLLEDSGMKSKLLVDLLADPKEIASLVEAESVVVFAKSGKTTYEEVEKTLEFLNEQEVVIIGGVNVN